MQRCYDLLPEEFGVFLSQFLINNIPIRNAGPAIITDQDNIYHSNLGFIAKNRI